jgi:hypothetical protein
VTTWEYDVVEWEAGKTWSGVWGEAGVRMMLEKYGEDGWELASTSTASSGSLWFFFKRPKSN